jgi:hypothetical protein
MFIIICDAPSRFSTNPIWKNPSIQHRLNVLGVEINRQIKRIEREENSELLEIKNLFYDSFQF